MWQGVSVVTKPASLPVDVATVKARTRIDHADDDTLVAALIAQAVARIDGPNGIGVGMVEQTWRKSLDRFPLHGRACILLPGWPIKSVSSITYVDLAGTTQTMPAEDYRVDLDAEPVRIEPVYGGSWPGTRDVIGAVKVDYVVGEADAADMEPALVAAVCLLVAHWYEHRETASPEAMSEIPHGFEVLVAEHRRCHAGA
jgi:uncharacterized phiE125 gp8 family phage protein